jgi:ubiquinol-cytochrome c reductase cytochrome b subunit
MFSLREKLNYSIKEMSLLRFLEKHLINYPTPINLNYFWGFGSSLGIVFVFQIITGQLLTMHYTPHISLAFFSVEHIMRDVNNGWLLRYMHANGASFVFILLYLHLFRGLYYSSFLYPYILLWVSGVILFILMMATAFMGYVLPFGQMSFWGATVIINLFSAIPYFGNIIVYWLLGGYAVENATLNRFFSLHYLLPFLIAGLTVIHLSLLHIRGSNNPLGITQNMDKINFYPYFYFKDLLGFLYIFSLFFFIIFFYPNILGHSDNYIEANSLVTPIHIVPEWYFLPFYAILRSIPDKLGGVVCMGLALIILIILPFIVIFFNINFNILKEYVLFNFNKNKAFIEKDNKNIVHFFYQKKNYTFQWTIKSPLFRDLYRINFWLFFFNLVLLGYIGGQPVEAPYVFIGQICTFFYFFSLVIIIPLCFILENSFFYFINFKKNSEKLNFLIFLVEEKQLTYNYEDRFKFPLTDRILIYNRVSDDNPNVKYYETHEDDIAYLKRIYETKYLINYLTVKLTHDKEVYRANNKKNREAPPWEFQDSEDFYFKDHLTDFVTLTSAEHVYKTLNLSQSWYFFNKQQRVSRKIDFFKFLLKRSRRHKKYKRLLLAKNFMKYRGYLEAGDRAIYFLSYFRHLYKVLFFATDIDFAWQDLCPEYISILQSRDFRVGFDFFKYGPFYFQPTYNEVFKGKFFNIYFIGKSENKTRHFYRTFIRFNLKYSPMIIREFYYESDSRPYHKPFFFKESFY